MTTLADKRRPALGRGMAALLANAPPPTSAALPSSSAARGLMVLPVEALERNPGQPRKTFDEGRLEELTASIREHGVVEPILVRKDDGKYQIVAGERRWRAAQRAGLKEVPVLVREATEQQAFVLALVENIQRSDLNAMEEAEAYDALGKEHGLTQEAIALQVGKSRSTVANALRLLRLPAEVRDALRQGAIEMGHARALLGLEDDSRMTQAAQRVIRQGLSVRATESLVRSLRPGSAGEAPAPLEPSPAIRSLVERLQRRLGARCRVIQKANQTGRLEIDYTSLDELDGILAKIGA